MNALLFKKTKDTDLFKGLKVAYHDATSIGTITEILSLSSPIMYEIDNSGLYLADEITLIEANDFDTLRRQVSATKNFVRVTERLFYYALEVLPPIYLNNGCFQMGECYSSNLFYTFGEKDGCYYGCLCNKNFALNNW